MTMDNGDNGHSVSMLVVRSNENTVTDDKLMFNAL